MHVTQYCCSPLLLQLLLLSAPSSPSLLLHLPSPSYNCTVTLASLTSLITSTYKHFWEATGGLQLPQRPTVILPR